MSIAILCPTRGRPEQFKRMCESADKTTVTNVEVLALSNGEDDYAENVPTDLPTVMMWNLLAKATDAKLLMLGADDTIFTTPGWDEALIDHYNKLENKIHVYALQDSRDPEGTPHPIVTREYIDAMGYFIPPIFLHWFVDTWTVQIAKANNCFTHLKHFGLTHDKPSDRGIIDDTHSRIRRMGWHERDTYVNQSCHHFLDNEIRRLDKAIQSKRTDTIIARAAYDAGEI